MAKLDFSDRKLYRSKKDRIVFGVCGGVAEYLGIDSTLVRIIAVLLLFTGTWFAILYLILGVIIPENPNDKSIPAKTGMKDSYLLLGAGLIVLGVIILLNNYGYLRWSDVWPIILVILGGYLIWQDRNKNKKK